MGNFLEKLFQNKTEKYLLSMIQELKTTISELRNDKALLQAQINDLIDKVTDNTPKTRKTPVNAKLTKLETSIYEAVKKYKTTNAKELSKVLILKESSLRVYISRIKNKGFDLTNYQ